MIMEKCTSCEKVLLQLSNMNKHSNILNDSYTSVNYYYYYYYY